MIWVLFGGISAFLWLLAVAKLDLSFAFPISQAGSIVLIAILSLLSQEYSGRKPEDGDVPCHY